MKQNLTKTTTSTTKVGKVSEKKGAIVYQHIRPTFFIETSQATSAVSTSDKPAVNINEIGKLDGKDIIDVEPEDFEDKPWRKPGADITDYFNFGFDERTWRLYCEKQRLIRDAAKAEMRQSVSLNL